MKIGDHVTCRCAPGCGEKGSWDVTDAIIGRNPIPCAPSPDINYGRPRRHGPCISGVVVEIVKDDPELDPGVNVLVRQDHGGITRYFPCGYGQYSPHHAVPEVWSPKKQLVTTSDQPGEP